MHPNPDLECSKVRQDTTLKQEKIPDKKRMNYNTKNQYITPRIKAKRRLSTGQSFLPFFTNSV